MLEHFILWLIICFIIYLFYKGKNKNYQQMNVSQMNSQQRKEFITSFSLSNCKHGNQGYKRVLLQLFGLLGNGKSSFINSCKFVLDGVYRQHAEARATDGGCTTRRVPYKLTDAIMMVDNRGCPTLSKYESGEILAQLGNLLPLSEEVEWCEDFAKNIDRLMDESKNPNYTDFIFPIYVHSVKNTIPKQEIEMYKELLNMARVLTGITPIIVLTHKSHGGLTAMRTTFQDMGFDKIFTIENYTENDHQRILGKHEEIQKLLCQVLKNVDFCMEKERNREHERGERMKFVIKYIKDADDEKKKREYEEKMESLGNLRPHLLYRQFQAADRHEGSNRKGTVVGDESTCAIM
ncbi:Hypothetical predicted protein [Pelobates cultripes]|uniref:Uncharacterized protein n=1 Tax=Pelobates cultripes TaxID=61616 RepID=A0AAD1SWM7_PELCU|nr:Hypothetical predicted protein [Pelobates cultripes]